MPTKDADARLDYAVDWSAWLPAGDTVATATWIVPTGLDSSDETLAGAKATIWLAGGDLGKNYTVTCRVTTTQGRIDDRSIQLRIVDY